jgi:spoIIIJ-associated protein
MSEEQISETAEEAIAERDDDDDDDLDDDQDGEGEGETSSASNDTDENGQKKKRRRRRNKPQKSEVIEPPDEKSAMALEFVTHVVEDMELDCDVRLRRPGADSPDEISIEIVGRDSGRIIGKKGQVLQALQFLTHRVINRPGEDKRHILVDAEGYRSRRDTNLASMARKLGKQALELGKIITFEPMNPRDRRVVHMALANFEGVVTKSDGEGDDRRVQIIPVRR